MVSRFSSGDAPLPVKLENNEFARGGGGRGRKKFRNGFGDMKGHVVSINAILYFSPG